MIRSIAFDFDGVLFESVDVKTQAFRELFAAEPAPLLAQILDFHILNGGISRFEKFKSIYRDILKRPLDDTRFQQLCQQFADLVVHAVVNSSWVPGAREFLDANSGKYQFFVVSATPDTEIKEIVRQKHIEHYFADVLGSPRKKADLLADVMNRYGLRSTEMLYVGDAVNDWHAAREHQIPFIWRRLNAQVPLLPDYQGPLISSMMDLEKTLIACRV